MDWMKAMEQRHSVRAYTQTPIEGETLAALEACIAACNAESGLHIQLVANEPRAFSGRMAHYGNFSGVTNYIAMIGKKSARFEELCGYYGEKIILTAQALGLNTCWVALTYQKIPSAFTAEAGEKLVIVIAVGYGKSNGAAHKSKNAAVIGSVTGAEPEWYQNGVRASLLAPTAVNQQKLVL